ncbi:MAG: glycosyltransferase family 4 protein [Anaerolineaceae bacterium]|nr:glycosyltransferase family 4 protein [Anaerolineaceae bacterium]
MRVLILTHEYPPVGGGGGRVVQDEAEGMALLGHDILILTAHHGALAKEEKQDRITIRRLPSLRKEAFRADLKAMGGFVTAAFFSGIKAVHQWRPDVIHAHFAVPSGFAAMLLSLVTRVPYVITAHLGDVPGASPEKTGNWFRYIQPFTQPIWKHAAAVTAVSDFTRQLALRTYDVKIEVVHNGVDLNEYDPGKIRVNQPPVIFFAGRFAEQKNLLNLVRVLGRLKDLQWSAVLAGDGMLMGEVRELLNAEGIADRVKLPGWVTTGEVLDWKRQSDILFMPSLSEGLSIVGLQAMAMGLALVMSDAGGNVDLVEQGVNGYLFAPNAVDAYETALRGLLQDQEILLGMRRASRGKAEAYALPRIVAEYEAVLQRAGRH